jgi:hypothetical protein
VQIVRVFVGMNCEIQVVDGAFFNKAHSHPTQPIVGWEARPWMEMEILL